LKALGRHILAEFFECDTQILNDSQMIEIYMKQAAIDCNATIINSVFQTFNPHVIAESHLAIHTWPEYGYAAVDVFTCGETVDPWVATRSLQELLKAQNVTTVEMKRGEIKSDEVLHHKPIMMQELAT
jgi:S-adenosylmethionine decarboxylase